MKITEVILNIIIHIIRTVIIFPIDTFLDNWQARFASEKPSESTYLNGNYAPVSKEVTAFNLPVTYGEIPSDLVGEFVRNGPNPIFVPKGGYHWFDGDGMLHGVRLTKEGKVSYVNRYTKTKAMLAEIQAGHRLKLRIGEFCGKIGLVKLLFQRLKMILGLIPKDLGSTANTALVFHNNKLQALLEADVPYEIRMLYDGSFETAARLDYGGKLRNMTAHPKVDPVTKELFFFGYSILTQPWLIYGYIDAAGKFVRSMEIPLPEPIMMHDMAITERHAIFLDTSLVFKKEKIITGNVFQYDTNHVSRLGIMDRYAKNPDGIKWFEIPTCHVFHTANAWVDGDEVVVASCRARPFDLYTVLEHPFEMVKWRCNMKTGKATEEVICPGSFSEFPQVHPKTLGRKSKYVYVATKPNARDDKLTGVLKMDLDTYELLGSYYYGDNKYAGEATFVAKANGVNEDDGYLLTFVHDYEANQSSFVVLDAKELKLLATVNLPQRVPFGFHGIFVSEDDILSQLAI